MYTVTAIGSSNHNRFGLFSVSKVFKGPLSRLSITRHCSSEWCVRITSAAKCLNSYALQTDRPTHHPSYAFRNDIHRFSTVLRYHTTCKCVCTYTNEERIIWSGNADVTNTYLKLNASSPNMNLKFGLTFVHNNFRNSNRRDASGGEVKGVLSEN